MPRIPQVALRGLLGKARPEAGKQGQHICLPHLEGDPNLAARVRPAEEVDESQRDASMEADPAVSGLGETVQAGWQRVQHDQSLALTSIPLPHDEANGLPVIGR